MTFYAHSRGTDKEEWQSLKEHLEETAELTRKLSADTKQAEFACIAARLHDIGKYSKAFQRKLDGAKIKIDHSTAGAQEAVKLFQKDQKQKFLATMLAYCIAGHHSGLPDFGSSLDCDIEGTLKARLKKKVHDYYNYTQEVDISDTDFPDYIPIKPIRNYYGFSLAFFTRMVYSVLVDADHLETERFMQRGLKPRGAYPRIDQLAERLDDYLKKFENPKNPIDEMRTQTLITCIAKATEKPGLYSLTVPTGGGKTLASLAFGLKHAVQHGLNRIIYVIPYTSIIDQNAAEFKKCLGDENVLEHHSNFDWKQPGFSRETESYDDETNEAIQKLRLAAENWDIPVVATTNVQFFESLFANRSSRCRKLHNIAKSVVIFDEAQMLPREYLKPCLYAVYELVKNYGVTAVFCTATQPVIEQFLPEGAKPEELTPNPHELYNFYKRVGVKNLGILSDDELTKRINEQKQALCIVNTRRHAKGLFEGIEVEGRFHLSTLMCPTHRRETIATIRKRLGQGLACRVVSTQIMEAGIDVDFPTGYRAIAGLDSIIQAAGRVNREGKRSEANLYVFEPDSLFVKRTPKYIRQGAEIARSILRDYEDPASLEAIQKYFELLYDLQAKNAFDVQGIVECFEKGVQDEPDFDFKTAAERFKLIDDNTMPVIIPYDGTATSILREVLASVFPTSYTRKLQVYTVNIYEREYQALERMGLIDIYADTYAVLNDMNAYDKETGLRIPESSEGEAIFFDG